MTSKLTRERLQEIAEDGFLKHGESKELARMALAAMDCEPVAWLAIYHGEVYDEAIGITRSVAEAEVDRFGWEYGLTEIIPLYRHAQPAPKRDQVRNEHAEWSQATFGNVGPIGPLKHLSKEALEAAAEPADLSEWADMQFLLWDAQRRAGITDEQITQAMVEKLAVNKQREWPEPKDGEPRLHIKEQMVPVTQQEPIAWLNDAYLARGVVDGEAGSEDAGPGYIPVYREPATQAAPVVPEGLNPETTDLVLRFASALADKLYKAEQKYGRSTDWMKDDWYDDCLQSLWEHIEKGDPRDVAAYCAFMWYHGWVTTDYDRNVQNACRAAMLQADNTPVIGIDLASGPDRSVEVRYVAPPGYVMVPKEPTKEILDEFDSIIDYGAEDSVDAWSRLIAAAHQGGK